MDKEVGCSVTVFAKVIEVLEEHNGRKTGSQGEINWLINQIGMIEQYHMKLKNLEK